MPGSRKRNRTFNILSSKMIMMVSGVEIRKPWFESHAMINSSYPTVTFTLEVEGSKIDFLYLSINMSDDSHEFHIYRESKFSNMIIDGTLFHLPNHIYSSLL